MLDVHAPHHTPSGTRDFFIHIFTITVGLLIALGLENAAEALHHHHQRREAEAMIREEIKSNAEMLESNARPLQEEARNMKLYVLMCEAVMHNEKPPADSADITFGETEIPDAAWRTATNTGALQYMPFDEVGHFSDAYREQALLQSLAQKALEDYFELIVSMQHDPAHQTRVLVPTREEAERNLPIARRALGHVNGMFAAGNGTMSSYKAALN